MRRTLITLALALLAVAACGPKEADELPGGPLTTTTTTTTPPETTTTAPPPAPVAPETTVPSNAGPITNSDNIEHPPPDDVQLGECTGNDFGGPTATGTLTNHTSKQSHYSINVNFTDAAGVIIAQGWAYVSNIPPGASATWEAMSFDMDAVAASCAVAEVERFAA